MIVIDQKPESEGRFPPRRKGSEQSAARWSSGADRAARRRSSPPNRGTPNAGMEESHSLYTAGTTTTSLGHEAFPAAARSRQGQPRSGAELVVALGSGA